MKDLRHPAKSLYQNELNLEDEIIASTEDYHTIKRLDISYSNFIICIDLNVGISHYFPPTFLKTENQLTGLYLTIS